MGGRVRILAMQTARRGLVLGVLLALATGCSGSWIVHEAQHPKGGVLGYKQEHRAKADMRTYCNGGPFQIVSRWDSPPVDGPVNYTIGGRNHTAFLEGGYYYFAFVCGESNDMPGVQGERAPMGEDVRAWDADGERGGYGSRRGGRKPAAGWCRPRR